MKLLIFFGAVLALAEGRAVTTCQDVVTVNGIVHKKDILKENVDSPYQLAIDRDRNTLYFSYTANKDEVFEVVYINLKDKTSESIQGIAGGFANAFDNKDQIVYIGGRDGIYTFDLTTKKVTKLTITNSNIWQLFYKNGLYFTTYPDEKVYLYKDGVSILVPELSGKTAMLIGVGNDNTIYYTHDGELSKIHEGVHSNLGDFNINAFNTDIDGNLYFSTPTAIFRIVKGGDIERIVEIPNLYGFAIDSDNTIIYADQNKVVKLVPTNEICYTDGGNKDTLV